MGLKINPKGRTVKKNTEFYQLQLDEKFNKNIKCIGIYIDGTEKIEHYCVKHEYSYISTPQAILGSVTGCPKCGLELNVSKRSQSDEQYKEKLNNQFNGHIINTEPYVNMFTKIEHYCNIHNEYFKATPQSTLYNNKLGCPKCKKEYMHKKMGKTGEQFQKEVFELAGPNYIASGEYYNYSTPLEFTHITKDGEHKFITSPSSFVRGTRCWCENNSINTVIVGVNDLATTNPELVNCMQNPELATKYTKSSKEKIGWNCPECSMPFEQSIADITHNRLSCPFCSDGISYPNKFIYHMLYFFKNDLEELKREFNPEWCIFKDLDGKERKGFYDIYFIKDSQKYIVEMDGAFHYDKKHSKGLTAEVNQYYDLMKDKLAQEHNIKVIRINCNYLKEEERYEYVKRSIIASELNGLFDISKINFDEINRLSLSSLIIKAGNLWNEGKTSGEICKELDIGKTTVYTYLKQCADIGYCDYSSETSRKRSIGTKVKNLISGKIYLCVDDAHKETGIAKNTIYRHCKCITKNPVWTFVQ